MHSKLWCLQTIFLIAISLQLRENMEVIGGNVIHLNETKYYELNQTNMKEGNITQFTNLNITEG